MNSCSTLKLFADVKKLTQQIHSGSAILLSASPRHHKLQASRQEKLKMPEFEHVSLFWFSNSLISRCCIGTNLAAHLVRLAQCQVLSLNKMIWNDRKVEFMNYEMSHKTHQPKIYTWINQKRFTFKREKTRQKWIKRIQRKTWWYKDYDYLDYLVWEQIGSLQCDSVQFLCCYADQERRDALILISKGNQTLNSV